MPAKSKQLLAAIFLVWLFHLSGIAGIALGYQEWFIPKTPLNLLVSSLIFAWVYAIDSYKKLALFVMCFSLGMFAEWLGVNYSLLFGSYDYGTNLGPKLDGVPWFIGINWAMLTFITATLATALHQNLWVRALIGATLMVFLDLLLEQNAPQFDFWQFEGAVPLDNYITWFVLAFGFNWTFQKLKISGNYQICLHLFLAQLLFFGYFTLFPL